MFKKLKTISKYKDAEAKHQDKYHTLSQDAEPGGLQVTCQKKALSPVETQKKTPLDNVPTTETKKNLGSMEQLQIKADKLEKENEMLRTSLTLEEDPEVLEQLERRWQKEFEGSGQHKEWKCTILHFACSKGATSLVNLLLQRTEDCNTMDVNSWTPLHWASRDGHGQIAKMLLDHNAVINARTNLNKTPLHLASDKGHLEVVRHLLQRGADVNAKDMGGHTPLSCAKSYPDVTILLEKFGAS